MAVGHSCCLSSPLIIIVGEVVRKKIMTCLNTTKKLICIISGSNFKCSFIVGDPTGDGYPGAGAGTSVAVSGVWQAHAASAYQGTEEQRD